MGRRRDSRRHLADLTNAAVHESGSELGRAKHPIGQSYLSGPTGGRSGAPEDIGHALVFANRLIDRVVEFRTVSNFDEAEAQQVVDTVGLDKARHADRVTSGREMPAQRYR